MKLTVSRSDLQNGLAVISPTIPVRSSIPILSNVLVEANDGIVKLTANDLDIVTCTAIPATVGQSGSTTVPGRKFREVARSLSDEPVVIDMKDRQTMMTITCGESVFNIRCMPADDFPATPEVDDQWNIAGAHLLQLIEQTEFAVSTEISRPVLNGIFWEFGDFDMSMTATNGHRLAKMVIPLELTSPAKRDDIVVPPDALRIAHKLFSANDEIRAGVLDNRWLKLRSGETSIHSRLIDGKYPDYRRVIPDGNDKTARIEKDALLAAVRRMDVIATDQTRRIRLRFSAESMSLDVSTPDLGDAHDVVGLEYEGDDLDIGFNAGYLLEVLGRMPTKRLEMTFSNAERASLVKPLADEDNDPDYLCIVMPLRLLD